MKRFQINIDESNVNILKLRFEDIYKSYIYANIPSFLSILCQ